MGSGWDFEDLAREDDPCGEPVDADEFRRRDVVGGGNGRDRVRVLDDMLLESKRRRDWLLDRRDPFLVLVLEGIQGNQVIKRRWKLKLVGSGLLRRIHRTRFGPSGVSNQKKRKLVVEFNEMASAPKTKLWTRTGGVE